MPEAHQLTHSDLRLQQEVNAYAIPLSESACPYNSLNIIIDPWGMELWPDERMLCSWPSIPSISRR